MDDQLITKALAAGAAEINLRVSLYGHNDQPDTYQAIVRFRDATKAWGLGNGPDAVEALEAALTDAIRRGAILSPANAPSPSPARSRSRRRVELPTPVVPDPPAPPPARKRARPA